MTQREVELPTSQEAKDVDDTSRVTRQVTQRLVDLYLQRTLSLDVNSAANAKEDETAASVGDDGGREEAEPMPVSRKHARAADDQGHAGASARAESAAAVPAVSAPTPRVQLVAFVSINLLRANL